MAIFRKEHLNVHLEQLEKYYGELRDAVKGDTPNINNCHHYNCESDQFIKEFTDIDLDKLTFAIGHFKVAVEGLKHIKKKTAKRNHQ